MAYFHAYKITVTLLTHLIWFLKIKHLVSTWMGHCLGIPGISGKPRNECCCLEPWRASDNSERDGQQSDNKVVFSVPVKQHRIHGLDDRLRQQILVCLVAPTS